MPGVPLTGIRHDRKGNSMKNKIPAFGLLCALTLGAQAADAQVQTCEQIREDIKAVTGLTPAVNPALLQKIGLRSDCQFSSAEVYRAAYGDKPIPKQEPYRSHENHDAHGDDD
jgi:hypothetical protein